MRRYKDHSKEYAYRLITRYGGNLNVIKKIDAATQKTVGNVARSALSTENYYKWLADQDWRPARKTK